MNPAVVHLVDDDDSHLRALARLLAAQGFQVRAHASGESLLQALAADARGCVVADLDMPGMDGLGLQRAMRESGFFMPVVFLTGHADIPSTVSAMREGAIDFLEKHAPNERLVDAINRALELDRLETARQSEANSRAQRFARLTRRELEVLREVVKGLMNKQIAAVLGVSERTVKMHRTAISQKVGVHSVAQLVTLARDAGLVDDTAETTR
jgi:FixJ family two-component response regulator